MYFPTAGIECHPLVPFAAALGISFGTSMGGISGAFLLLPFHMSVLGYVNPSVSSTNQFFNVLACPSGVWRYWREGRMLWPLAFTVALGTLPGVFLGAVIRLTLRRTQPASAFLPGWFCSTWGAAWRACCGGSGAASPPQSPRETFRAAMCSPGTAACWNSRFRRSATASPPAS